RDSFSVQFVFHNLIPQFSWVLMLWVLQKRQRAGALRDAIATYQPRGDSARFWTAAALCRFVARRIAQTSSFTRSSKIVVAIFMRFGVPRASASAKCNACFASIFGGIGGSNGSTTHSTSTGPGA